MDKVVRDPTPSNHRIVNGGSRQLVTPMYD